MFLGLEYEIENGKILLTQILLIEKAAKMYNIKYGAKILTTKFSNSQISLRQSIDSALRSYPQEPVADKNKILTDNQHSHIYISDDTTRHWIPDKYSSTKKPCTKPKTLRGCLEGYVVFIADQV
jgi:hypothetical protein